jgi:uncharacterized damage-inducible protein DinB
MSEVERIADQLKRAYEGNAWHGDSLTEVLAGVTADMAAARPIGSAHSIWEIVGHVAAWHAPIGKRLEGEAASLSPEEDWPAVTDTSEEAWKRTLEGLERSYREVASIVSRLDESRLDEVVPGGISSVYVTAHGLIQHTLYHAGQVAILKRAFG